MVDDVDNSDNMQVVIIMNYYANIFDLSPVERDSRDTKNTLLCWYTKVNNFLELMH